MSPYDFARLADNPQQEALCHAVFDEAHQLWIFKGRREINEAQLTLLCVETFFGEVCNGGLDQYLLNESGRIASFAPDSLRRVGLPEFASVLVEALGF